MQLLKLNATGAQVKKWQSFLFGIGYEQVEVDGKFGPDTEAATKRFQTASDLPSDGAVGNKTYAAAGLRGFPIVSEDSVYPPKPDFPYPSEEIRTRMLGKMNHTENGDGSINILHNWTQENLLKVYVPQLKGIENAPKDCKIVFHKNGAKQIQALFAAWEAAGLLHYVKTWAGTFNPRMIRGSSTAVSNHAYGSAFDINAAWNGLGHTPPGAGEEGTVVPLAALANAHGFFWGGHYNNRKDGMHFELAVLNRYPKSQISSAAAPAVIQPISSPSEPGDEPGFDTPAAASANADNSNDPAGTAPPPTLPESKTVDIPQVVAEAQPDKEITGIKASFAGAVTFLTTSGAGLFALFQGVQKELIYGLFAAAAAVGIVFIVTRFRFADREKQREHAERMEREKRAHEIQLATINTAARKDLNTVNVVPQPILNSEPSAVNFRG